MATSGQVNSAAALPNVDTKYTEQHVFYIGVDGSLNQTWWDGRSPWKSEVLPGSPASDPVVLYEPFGGTQYSVFFRDVRGRLVRTFWTFVDIDGTRGWVTEILPGAPAGNIDCGYYVPPGGGSDDGEQHVFFAEADNFLHQTWTSGAGWATQRLPGSTGVPGHPYAGVSTLTYGDEQHVFYAPGKLAQSWWDGQTWQSQLLPGIVEGPPSAMRCDKGENLQHVMFASPSPKPSTWTLQQSWWDGSQWQNQTLPGLASSPNVLAAAFTNTKQGSRVEQHIFYVAPGGSLGQSWWDGQGWHSQSLPGSPQRLLGVFAYYELKNPELHVFFRATDAALTQTWWDGYQWQTQSLPAATPVRS
jgi:hypothetical protein